MREFNNRVRGRESAFEFPETAMPEWLPPAAGRSIFQERFLALENDEVRGGYALKRQDFSFRGVAASVACYHSALSEGVANERYRDLDGQLISDALTREPLLYTLEADRAGRTPAHAAQTSEWKRSAVPGYFRIVHPGAFLRNMETLRTTAWRRFLLSLAALTGLGWAGVRLHQRVKAKPQPAPPATVDFFDVFGAWSDDLWTQCAPRYPFLAVRDRATLAILYPGGKFLRMKIASGGATIGWAVAVDTQMQWNREFGDMRLGSLIDCLALPEHAPQVITAVRRVLERRGRRSDRLQPFASRVGRGVARRRISQRELRFGFQRIQRLNAETGRSRRGGQSLPDARRRERTQPARIRSGAALNARRVAPIQKMGASSAVQTIVAPTRYVP